MKKITLVLVFMMVTALGNAQVFQWAKQIAGTGTFNVQIKKAISLRNGDLFVCGSFSGTVDFNPGTLVTNRTSQGKDGFVAKYFSNGDLAWVTTTNSAGDEEIVTIATSFNPSQLEGYQAVVAVGNNAFKFIKFTNLEGKIILTSQLYTSTGTVTIGNIYENGNDMVLVGSFTGTLTLGSVSNVLVSAGLSDGFYMYQENNLTNYLTPSIIKRHGGTNNEFFHDIALQANTIVGSFEGITSLGNPEVNYTSNGGKDGLMMSVNFSTGDVSNIAIFGGTGDDEVTCISKEVTTSSNLLTIGGYFSNTVDFDPSNAVSDRISVGGKDGFVANYNFRTLQFANGVGSSLDDDVSCVASKSGSISYTARIGTISGKDIQIGSLSSVGVPVNFGGYFTSSGSGDNVATTIENFTSLSVYVVGSFNKPTDFDTGFSTNTLTPIAGGTNSFIQRYSTCQSFLNAPMFYNPPSASSICVGGSVLLSLNRNTNIEGNGVFSWYAITGTNNNCTGSTFVGTGTSILVYPTTTTTYYALQTGCSGNGTCQSGSGVTITVTGSNAPTNATTQTSSVITATETGAAYQWLDCYNGGQVISGATSQSYSPTYSGAFAVRVTKNSCQSTSECVDFVLPLHTNSLTKLGIKLYPNPVQNNFTIEGDSELEKVTLYNLLGQRVKSFTQTTNTFDMSEVTSGTYLVEVQTSQGKATTRIIKQ